MRSSRASSGGQAVPQSQNRPAPRTGSPAASVVNGQNPAQRQNSGSQRLLQNQQPPVQQRSNTAPQRQAGVPEGAPHAQRRVTPEQNAGNVSARTPEAMQRSGQRPAANAVPSQEMRRSALPAGNGGNTAVRPAAPVGNGRTNAARGTDSRLDRTRVTDISTIQRTGSVSGNVPVKTIKPKTPRFERTEVVYEDEGGNTIVSMVKAVVYMIFVVVVSVFLAIAIIKVGNDVFAFVKDDVSIDVRIPEYATLDDITQILYENEVIRYPSVFKIYAQLKKDKGEYIAGDYVVRPNMSYDDLRDSFKPQPKVGISRITIPEGYTTDEIIDLMVSYGIGTREGYVDAIQNYEFDYWFLKELEEDGLDENRIYRLDGYLFPDTYDFYNSSSEVTVLNKLLKRFGQIFTEEYKVQASLLGYSVDDIINLASLIEKEAGTPSELFKVSSVFHNRLKYWKSRPMLESDATIVYAIQHETGERPKLTSTDYDTPYNTYIYAGLPPGPIANPSASAMLAALSPADTEYYYFVADGNVSYFSETKEQHEIFIEEIKKGTIREYVANMGTEEEEEE